MRDRPALVNALFVATIAVLLSVVGVALTTDSGKPVDRAAALETRLRCPVCKQVSIRDSPSETAAAMRQLVRTQVQSGRSDAEILGFFQSRYGAWILLDPPATGSTRWLFVLPGVAAAAGLLLVGTRTGRAAPQTAPLDEAMRARVAASLAALPQQDEGEDEP